MNKSQTWSILISANQSCELDGSQSLWDSHSKNKFNNSNRQRINKMQFTLDIGQEKKNAMFYSRTHLDHSKLYNHVSVKKKTELPFIRR